MSMRPFSIRLFAPSGDPEGVLVASRDDWPGRAIIFPRELVGEVRGRKEYAEPGVYLLVSSRHMYIGEGDPVGKRIDDHVKNKDFWGRGVFFTAEGRRLNKAHVQHLESRLVGLAKQAARVKLDNANTPQPPALSEEEHAFSENFLAQMLLTLPLLGFWQFSIDDDEVEADLESDAVQGETAIDAVQGKRAALYASLPLGLTFSLNINRVTAAKLEITDGGVIVKEGSTLVDPVNERFELNSPAYAALRRQLLEAGVIANSNDKLVFVKDQFFSSGSAAATVVRGNNSNADWWKGSDGKTLGEYIRDAKNKL